MKDLYAVLQGDGKKQSQITEAVSKQIQARKVAKKSQLQQSLGRAKITSDFMNQLSASLGRAQQADKKALMERVRSDERAEREEQEEQQQNQR